MGAPRAGFPKDFQGCGCAAWEALGLTRESRDDAQKSNHEVRFYIFTHKSGVVSAATSLPT